MTADEARARAMRLFGNQTLLKERTRDMDTLGWIETLVQDLRYALRMMRRSPGFTSVAVLSLALAIGANTAIFSLIDAVMLRMLPVSHAEQLVLLSWAAPKWGPYYHGYSGWGGCPDTPGMASGCSFSYLTFQEIRARNEVFSEVLAFAPGRVNVLVNQHADFEEAESVSGDYFSTLGVRPILGRGLTQQDDRPGADPVVVISYGLWLRRFGRDPSIVGKSIWINGPLLP